MLHVFLDFETYSERDLTRAGPDVYARHPSTRVLMLAWVVNPPRDLSEDDVRQWFPHEGSMPQELRELLENDAVILEAHNASFERLIFRHVLGMDIPVERWRDTMVRCFYAGLPGQLGKAAEVLGLPHDKAKDRRGKALIRRFCQPGSLGKSDVGLIPEDDVPWPEMARRAYPQEWEEFCRYNRQDVVAEVAVAYALSPVRVPQELWDEWFIDQRINDAGVPIRRPLVVNAVRVHEEERSRLLRRLSEITGAANPRSRAQLLKWLRANGYVRPDLTAASVRMALAEDDLSPEVREVLQLRQRASLTSGDKYATILDGLADDDHMRHVLQFHGAARTGRWSGRRWQPHNLARPPSSYCPEPAERGQKVYKAMATVLENGDLPWLRMIDDVPTLLKGLSRAVMQAPPGKMFCDCDLSAIENITLGWLAGEEKILRVFREGRDPYIDFATYMFGQSYDEIWHEVKVEKKGFKRKIAKPATLGCGYMLGPGKIVIDEKTGLETATGLIGYARDMGIDMTPEQAQHAVQVFRDTYQRVRALWYEGYEALCATVLDGKPRVYGGKVRLEMAGQWLRAILPSGRAIHYYRPRVKMRETPWGEIKPQFEYEGKRPNGSWGVVSSHPGKCVENFVQAIARDILMFGIRRAHEAGLDVRLHVHDQIVVMADEERAQETLEKLRAFMTAEIPWARDMPLKAGGFTTPIFMKD